MDEKFKDKILAWVERVTRYKGNDFISDEESDELLEIINEEIEEKSNEAFERGKFIHISFDK